MGKIKASIFIRKFKRRSTRIPRQKQMFLRQEPSRFKNLFVTCEFLVKENALNYVLLMVGVVAKFIHVADFIF